MADFAKNVKSINEAGANGNDHGRATPAVPARLPLVLPSPRIADVLPKWLREQPRWAPWRARWNEGRRKYDKIPAGGLSTAHPERWLPFDTALDRYQSNSDTLAGIGFVLTGISGVVGVDLDGCTDDAGVPNDFARAVLADLRTGDGVYVERSPSGRGLRAFLQADIGGADFTDHGAGLEVYGGGAARFLTVTGVPA